MKIVVSSIFVDDQEKALAFYTTKLGFVKKTDIPLGAARWLTVVAPNELDGTELVLEPDSHPAVGPFKRTLIQDGIPFTSFAVEDIQAEYERLRSAGVVFTQPPVTMGPVMTAVLDDTCGNLIQLAQKVKDIMPQTPSVPYKKLLEDLRSPDPNRQNYTFQSLLTATDNTVDWAYEVWDDLLRTLVDGDNRQRSIAAQVLSNLAKSDPKGRMLKDLAALLRVTRKERFVTARHCLQSLWKVGVAGELRRKALLKGLAARFKECKAEKNCTLMRYDILVVLWRVFDLVNDEEIRLTAERLMDMEEDFKYRKKYATVWRKNKAGAVGKHSTISSGKCVREPRLKTRWRLNLRIVGLTRSNTVLSRDVGLHRSCSGIKLLRSELRIRKGTELSSETMLRSIPCFQQCTRPHVH